MGTSFSGGGAGGGSSLVSSVFGRIGAVVAVLGDYATSLIDNDSTVAGATASDALDTLQSSIAALVTGVSSVFGRTGAVVAALNDYSATLIDNDSNVPGTTVADALNSLFQATEENLGNTGASAIIDYDNGILFKLANIDQNTSLTIDTPPNPEYLHLRLTNSGTFTVSFTNTIQWKDNSPYVASGTDSDLVILYWSGSVILGSWGSYGV